MANQVINKTIRLKYEVMQTGAKDLIAMIDKMDMTKLDEKTKKYWATVKDQAIKSLAGVSTATQEGFDVWDKHYKELMKNAGKATQSMINGISPALSKQMTDLVEQVDTAQILIDGLEKKKNNLGINKDGGNRTIKSGHGIDNEAIQRVKDGGNLKGEMLSNRNQKLKTLQAVLKTRDQLLASATKEQKIELEKNINSEASKKIMEELIEKSNSKLTIENALNQVQNARAIELEREKIVQEQLQTYGDIEAKQAAQNLIISKNETEQEKIQLNLKKEGAATEGNEKEKQQKTEIAEAIKVVTETKKKYIDVNRKEIDSVKEDTNQKDKNLKKTKEQGGAIAKATKQVLSYGLAFSVLRRMYRETIQTITELDEALTEMAIVTSMNRKDTWELVGTMQDLAKETGFTTTEISKLSTVYFRQGRALSDVIELTTVAAKAARVAGISAQESADYLTSAINGFGLAADQALAVSDKFAALAATSASSYEELAKGLSKFAAQANVAGISIDFAMGMLAKGVETTREAPETIGTALKTVLARLRELTDYGKTLEDGMDVNRVESALGQMNVQLMDSNGQFRDMESVITDLGMKWDTLNTNQQASIAVALAGTRQQSRLIAIMQDFDRTMNLVEKSEESAGATTAQHVEYMQSMAAAMVGLQNAWQKFITAITSSDIIITIVKTITKGLDILTAGLETFGGVTQSVVMILAGYLLVLKSWASIQKVLIPLMSKTVGALAAKTAATIMNTTATGVDIAAEGALAGANITTTAAMIGETAAQNAQSLSLLPLIGALLSTAAANIATGFSAIFAATGFKASTKAVISFTGSLLVNPIFLIATAITVLAAGLIRLAMDADRAQTKIEEMSAEIQAANYDINQTIKKVDALVEAIEKLNEMAFRTIEQEEELEGLQQSILDVVDKDYLFIVEGKVIWEASEDGIQAFLEKQVAEKEENTTKLFKETVSDTFWKRKYGKGAYAEDNRQSQYKDGLDSFIERKAVNDYLIQQYEKEYGEMSQEEEILYRQYMQKRMEMDPGIVDWQQDGKVAEYIENDMTQTLKVISKFGDAISKEDPLSTQLTSFFDTWKDASLEDKDFLEDYYSELFYIQENLGKETVKNLDKIGVTSTTQIQEGSEIYGDSFKSIIDLVSDRVDKLVEENMGMAEATSQAWAEMAIATEDSEEKVWLYAQAFIQTTQEMGQSLDNLSSKIDNVRSSQEKWLSGELSQDDLYQFIISHPDLFDNMETINAFINGDDITGGYFVDTLERERIALVALKNAIVVLANAEAAYAMSKTEDNEAAVQGALLNVALYKTMLTQTGALANLTDAQNDYNKTLLLSNLYEKLGIENAEIRDNLMKAQARNVSSIAQSTQKDLETIKENFNDNLIEGGLEGTFKDYFNIIDGVIVPIYSAMEGLLPAVLNEMDTVLENYQNNLNEAYDAFADLRDADLEAEQEKLDAQKELYEDYFDALDRLEEARNNKESREDIVAQLQRLEGATDEVSRQKALDLRKELNELDEESAEDRTEASREALLDSFNTKYDELVAQWALAGTEFINNMTTGGMDAGNAFVAAMRASGLFGDYDLDVGDNTKIKDFENESNIGSSTIRSSDEIFYENQDAINNEWITESSADSSANAAEEAYNTIEESGWTTLGSYSKGGIVDFTGVAALHGSKSNPEMVLDSEQTEMFISLRNTLGKLAFGGETSESINIEQITIKTDKLNSTQDFNKAGEILAKAFSQSIKNRGVTVNSKR